MNKRLISDNSDSDSGWKTLRCSFKIAAREQELQDISPDAREVLHDIYTHARTRVDLTTIV